MHARNNALTESPPPGEGFEQVEAIVHGIMRRDLGEPLVLRGRGGAAGGLSRAPPAARRDAEGRDARTERILGRLVTAGLLDGERVKRRLPELRVQIFTQIFFWLPSAILAAPDRDPADRLELHARAAMTLLLPVCTPSGRRKLDAVIDRRS